MTSMISPFGYSPTGFPTSVTVESYPVSVVNASDDRLIAPPLSAFIANGTSTVAPVPRAIP